MAKQWFGVVITYYANMLIEAENKDAALKLAFQKLDRKNLVFDEVANCGDVPAESLKRIRKEAHQVVEGGGK